jgi:hypothetical protein
MAGISDEAIRKRAYLIWEREGRPHGRDYDHWVRAQVELVAEAASGNGGPEAAASSRRTTARKDKPSPPSKSPAARGARAKSG